MNDKPNLRLVYADHEPELSKGMPVSLREVRAARLSFNEANDPLLKKQREAMRMTEKQRRDDGDGSRMIKLHKPFPELKPKHEQSPLRARFNRAWAQEYRTARLRQLDQQRTGDETKSRDQTHDKGDFFPER